MKREAKPERVATPRSLLTTANLVKAIKEPRKAASILLHRTFAQFGHRNYQKFVVLTRDRTGSNMLIQALNSHPWIASDYEIFGKLFSETEQVILDRCFGKQPFYVQAKGFKIFYYHPQDAENSPIWEMLRAIEDLHVIQLKRRNLLRAEISSRVAYTTGVYGVRSRKEFAQYQKTVAPVTFTHVGLDRLFRQNREWEKAGAEQFAGHPIIDLDYEDMVVDFDGEYRRILDFLGIEYRPPQTDFKKQGAKDMRAQVQNYDELKAGFIGTEWEEFFED